MGKRSIVILLLLLIFQVLLVAAQNVPASNQDFTALLSLTEFWENKPPSWVGTDPCAASWEGIECTNSRVTSIKLLSMNIKGSLTADIGTLSELETLSLVGCDFSGPIPESTGALNQLTFLALNLNRFSGNIPRSFGNLSNVNWLDIADNQIEGPIPISDEEGPGLDMLHKAEHFHFGNNRLSGHVQDKLFSSNMILKHLLLDNNKLNGSIPDTMGSVKTLMVIRYDHNQMSGEVPSISDLTKLTDLNLGNNKLTGSLPDLTGLNDLASVDLSNNSFNSSGIPSWASNLPYLTTLSLEDTGLQGEIPNSLFKQSSIEAVKMKNNQLNGTLDVGNSSPNLELIDLENNMITDFAQENQQINFDIILAGNSICLETGADSKKYCSKSQSTSTYSTQPNSCTALPCSSNMVSSPKCICAIPYTGVLTSRAVGFSNIRNTSYFKDLENGLLSTFQSLYLPVDSVSLSNPVTDTATSYFSLDLQVFPSQSDRFNRTGVSSVSFVLANQIYKPPEFFSPYYFSSNDSYEFYAEEPSSSKTNTGIIAGAVASGVVVLVLSILVVIFAIRQKKRAKEFNPFANWEQNNNSGNAPQLKGARWFSFEELKKYSNNFCEANTIGAGGYGKVYQAVLPSGELVAVKRASQESMQGAVEFKTEIELLSRVHHKNLVGLVGFCYDKGEQMLVYEYIPNGTIMDSLSGKSGIRMNWIRRLKVAVGAARGLAYLHELADPPIIHRDIKSSNILLDDHLNAKVADFGLSKLNDSDRGHVTTQVKGTMGYMDPEYYMTQQLTEKSDVYSFGVTMLELVTARKPIEQGKFIVREVLRVLDRSKEFHNLHAIIDPTIKHEGNPKGLEKFVDLALKCVKDHAEERPTMAEVVKEIENIIQLAGFNPNAESASTSETYDNVSGGKIYHPYVDEDFAYSSVFPSVKVEPQ
ncbi:leucine-rich repeat receptor protein kinase HPCA1-like isoform X2 [Prosopis cineraria]|uniref:leucine-rich repeat receptor protein kinase HPCA1-like isoform X2 n=1 Tax=Prosopis cineraria TaxID=364024 RepID=UPI00240F4ECF|nr:leucine-rich repeat receptor protein kinase HPCA1-like isoform X2 [Prosopis cineraria]